MKNKYEYINKSKATYYIEGGKVKCDLFGFVGYSTKEEAEENK